MVPQHRLADYLFKVLRQGAARWRRMRLTNPVWSDPEVLFVEVGKFDQVGSVQEVNVPVPELEKLALAQFAQHPVYVNGREPQRIRQVVLRERTGVALLILLADKPQPNVEFKQKVGCSLQRTAPSNIGQVLMENG